MTTQRSGLKRTKSGGVALIDLRGVIVGRLTVLDFSHHKRTAGGGRQYFWNCRCSCGDLVAVDGCCLRRKSTISCGCHRREQSTTHGLTAHYIYEIWHGMKQRCLNPKSQSYPFYGGRGITICSRWLESVANFYADMGDRPTSSHTIERVNNDGNYEPMNCRWASRAEQNENTRQTVLLTFHGETLSLGKWARKIGVPRRTLSSRLGKLGWPLEKALTTT